LENISSSQSIIGNIPFKRWFVVTLFLHALGLLVQAQVSPVDSVVNPAVSDSVSSFADSTATSQLDTLGQSFPGDSLRQGGPNQAYIDSLKATSDLQAEVDYKANDSIVFDVQSGVLFMYGSSNLNYEEIQLSAERVTVKIDSQTLFANGIQDSLGNAIGEPQFTMDGANYTSKEIAYNFKTQKGRVLSGRTVQGEGFILTDVAKVQPDGSLFGKDGKYTTCDDPHPHYYIRSRKLKLTATNQIISGPLNFVIADLPIPVVIPFAFIPETPEGEVDGILQPQYGNAQDRGYFLRGLGYYKAINEFMDIRVDGDIYTRGGWRVGLGSSYRIQHRFSGSFGFQYGVTRFNEKGDPDFRRTTAWNLTWNHNQPINPNTRISSSVNISSSNSFQREISYSRNDFFQNDLNSSINLQKTFANTPFSMNISARHQQDLNEGTMSMSLPELTFNMNRQNPFKNISNRKLDFLRQFGITYNMNARNRVTNLPDSLFLPVLFNASDSIFYNGVENGDSVLIRTVGSDFYQNGLSHNAKASTQVKLFKQINISPNFSYQELWYTETVEKVWNPETQRIEEFDVRGFQRAYNFNTSIAANTNFFGIYSLPTTRREIVVRQRFTPNISYNLKPDFSEPQWGFYREVQRDTLGNTQQYSIFENGIFGSPSRGESQSIGFGLGSVLEMKYRTKESFDPEFDEEKNDPFERTRIVDNLGLSSSYNFAADSFKLAPFSMRARTSLFNRKLSVNATATLDPYAIITNSTGNKVRVNRFMWTETGQIGRFTRAQLSFSTSLRGEEIRKKKVDAEDIDPTELRGIQNHAYQYVDFDIPWDIRLRYSLSYSNNGISDPRVVSTLNLDGSMNLTPMWKIQASSGFDIIDREITNTSISIFRQLHCWDMSFRWVPFGPQRSYSLVISVRSATLQALRLTKNNYWQDRFQ
jgi:hypothetical protein